MTRWSRHAGKNANEMREALLGKLVLVLSRATPKELAAIYRFATGEGNHELRELARMPKEGPASMLDAGSHVFRWTGRDWEVVFGGAAPFYLEDTLGSKYLNYLLHHPNEPIAAFDLEVAIMPEKGQARARDSIQPESDPQAKAQYRQALHQLQARREKAEAAGDAEQAERLAADMRKIAAVLGGNSVAGDTGERARNNVRRAIRVVTAELENGGPDERAFAEHLRKQLSTGHECQYLQPEGRIWK
jgi:hypothetical protein